MIRFLGPTGRRLHRALPGATLSAVLLTLLVAVPAWAANPGVQNTGAFQLDGNAQQSVPASTPGDDWDNICASNPSTCTFQTGFSASASTTTTASAHISDTAINVNCAGRINCTVFTGGGSKDPQNIPSWNWKTDSGGLPAKDNLAHSFAARYAVASTGTGDANCPAPTAGTDTCKVLYFGSDRIDNSGDAQEGFWFFQNKITLNTNGSFNGVHAVGDLLILSDFSNGGGTSTINIYKWVASGGDVSANLQSLGGSTGAACNRTPPPSVPDPFCGLVNPTDGTPAPWVFADKSGNSTYLNGELYEGGVNLSAPSINLGGECFATFASETRSSTSPTATLKDFVLGGFGNCTSGTTTTPEDSSGTSISNGQVSIGTGSVQAKDLAVVTGNGSTTKPTGTVTFYACGPAATDALAQCAAAPGPPSNGVQVGAAKTLAPGTGNTSTATSDLAAFTSVGHYCFRGDYSGDSLYPASSDNSLTECFEVTPVTPTLTTQASGPAQLGSAISDTATLVGTANKPGTPVINPTTAGGPAGGSITFTAYGPDNCSTSAFTTSRTVSGDGTYPTGVQAAVSFIPGSVGTYTWVASYSGDSPNTLGVPASACPDTTGTETVVVSDTTSVLTDQTWVPNDHAQISSAGGSALSGSVVFTLYDSADCTGTVLYTSSSIAVSGASPQIANSNNTTARVNATTTVSWKVVYTNTAANVTGSTSSCESTSLTIDNNPGYTPLP